MRALIVLAITLASTAVGAQPTTTKPDEVVPTTTTGKATIKITSKRFGTLKAGKKLTKAMLKKAFPKAKVATFGKAYQIVDASYDPKLEADVEATQISVKQGPVEAYGLGLGDDAAKLAGTGFAGATCWNVGGGEAGAVHCDGEGLTMVFTGCAAAKQAADDIPLDQIAGCKLTLIVWYAYAPKTK